MSGFVEKLFDSFTGDKHQQQQQSSYGGQPQQNYGEGQPQVSYPWVARWDDREQRYFYINEQTGERNWTPPSQGQNQGYGGEQRGEYRHQQNQYSQGGYGQQQQGQYGGGYGQQQNQYPSEERQEKKGHGNAAAWGIGGAALGLGAGALLMHEGEDIKEDWDQDKARFEQSASDFPEDAAEWTGRRVGEVEQIPENVEQGFDRIGDGVERKWDNAVDDVEDAPENVAGWVGEKVGDVERFGDDVENYGDSLGDAYDQGRDEGRDDDY